ncbi:MAG: PQQ-binding-like beta-propeller repeat protein [Bacteriovorax sp.]
MDALLWLSQNHELATNGVTSGIIPTVLIPLTAVTVGITSLAGIIAGWFGIKLRTEGPKQFLEVLLKKRILLSMIAVNLLGIGVYKSYVYVKTLPSFMITVKHYSGSEAKISGETYTESRGRSHDYNGEIVPANLNSIKLIQETKLPKGAFRSGLISGNSLFYGVDDGNIYEINKNDLSVLRKFYIGTMVTTRPVIYKNRLYSGEGNHETHHARIYSFDLKTGEFINAFKTKGHTEGQPLIGSYKGVDLLFVTAGSDGLYAVDPMTMKKIWHQNDGHLDATVTIENNFVFTGSGFEKGSSMDRSYAVAYDFATGKQIWKKELPLSNWMHPVVTNTDVCYTLGEIYFESTVGLFYCLNKLDGTPHFSIPYDAPLASKPYYIKNKMAGIEEEFVFFGDFKGQIHGVNITTKEKLWSVVTGSKDTNYALSSFDYDSKRGVLLYPSFDNGIFALEPKTGKIKSHWLPEKSEAKWKNNYASVSIIDNFFFLMDNAGNLRKFSVE